MAQTAPKKHRRFFQFTLRQLLLLLAVVGVLLGIVTPRIHRTFQLWRFEQNGRRISAANGELKAALRANSVPLARRALEAGADSNLMVQPPETRPFCSCIANGQIEMVQLLLDFGADVEQDGAVPGRYGGPTNGGSSLFLAAGCDQPPEVRCQMIRLLVKAGANPRRKVAQFNAMDVAYHLSDGLIGDLLREYGLPYGPREMAAFNRLDELKQAVRDAPELLVKRFPTTWAGQSPTLLGIALRRGYREMSLFLIEAGAPLDTVEHQGATLLMEAARSGDVELVRLLLARGLEVDATDDYKDTPLCESAGRKPLEVVAALIEAGADVNHQGVNGHTPLWGAAWGGRIDVAEMLLAAGADPTIADIKGETPLDVARKRNPEIAELLQHAAEQKSVPNSPD